jgi:hypothetical protein
MRKSSEPLSMGHISAAAKETAGVNCHWLISPAWRYAIATLKRLEEERLRCLKNRAAGAY